MRKRYPKKNCPRCGKRVMICITARSSAPGETRTHNCPHGTECYDGGWCKQCEEAMDGNATKEFSQ